MKFQGTSTHSTQRPSSQSPRLLSHINRSPRSHSPIIEFCLASLPQTQRKNIILRTRRYVLGPIGTEGNYISAAWGRAYAQESATHAHFIACLSVSSAAGRPHWCLDNDVCP